MGLLDTATSVFERRFLRNAFLPVLLFVPAVATPVLIQTGDFEARVSGWDEQSGALKVLELVLFLALVWFVAAILESQMHQVTQLFEGYRMGPLWPLHRAAISWHEKRRGKLTELSDQTPRYWAYALDEGRPLLPTRLGNILRSAELYPIDRYNADLFLLWSRLRRVFPDDFARDLEEARARMEFLLVISLWSAGFGVVTLLTLTGMKAAGWLTVACFVAGMAGAYVTYLSALPAAEEYGDRLRTGFDLYRFELLRLLRVKDPTTVVEENDVWAAVQDVIVYGFAEEEAMTRWLYQPVANPTVAVDLGFHRKR